MPQFACAELNPEIVRHDNKPIILGEVIHAEETSKSDPYNPGGTIQGFTIVLKVHEVLHFISAITSLSEYPNHRDEILKLLSKMANGPNQEMQSSAAFYLYLLYEFFPAGSDEKSMNRKVLSELTRLMSGENPILSDATARGLANLIKYELPKLCIQRQDLYDLARDIIDRNSSKEVLGSLNSAVFIYDREFKTKAPLVIDKNAPVVRQNLANYIGKRISLVGKPAWGSNSERDTAILVHSVPVWLTDVKELPRSHPFNDYMLATGTLAVKYDLPVFRYTEDKPFSEGLPVPEPYSMQEMSRRFVLMDVVWKFIE